VHARDDVLDVNPPQGGRSLTLNGSHWLWAVTAVFALSFVCCSPPFNPSQRRWFAKHALTITNQLACVVLGLRPRNGERIFHYLFTIALLVGAIAYFAMASDLGWSVVAQHLRVGEAATYQVFFAKYIYWVVAFPTIVIALGLVSGVSWATIVYNVFLTWLWIIAYLVGAYTYSRYKWGFFTFGTLAYLLLAYQTTLGGLSASKRFTVARDYTLLAGYANFLWFFYPIGWAITDGGNVIGVTQMAIYFGVLDLLLLPVLAFGFIFLSKRWDYRLMDLHFTQYGRVPKTTGTFPEKHSAGVVSGPGVGTGAGPTAPVGAGGIGTTGGYNQPAADYTVTGAGYTQPATTGRYTVAPAV